MSAPTTTVDAATLAWHRTRVAGDVYHYEVTVPIGSAPNAALRLHRVVRERAPSVPRPSAHAAVLLHGDFSDFATNFLPTAGDLFAVAQAWHWFNREAYLAEARRVAVPGAVLAVWTYNLHRVTEEVDSVVDALYAELDPWWPAERRHVEDGYAHLAPPGDEVPAPAFAMTA